VNLIFAGMKTVRKIFSILRNKYVYTTLGFLVFMIAFDRNNFVSQYQLTWELKQLQNEKAYYVEEIRKDSTALMELKTNMESLEKFGRERYYMKKDSEDIFVIIP